MLSWDNLDVLEGLRLANGQAVEYIVAVAARRYGEWMQPVLDRHCVQCHAGEDGQRLVIAAQANDFLHEGLAVRAAKPVLQSLDRPGGQRRYRRLACPCIA